MSFLDLLKIEFMKVKRSKIVPLIFIAPLLVVVSGVASLSNYFTPEYTNAWPAMFIQSALVYAYYLLPFSMIVVCVMIAGRETGNNGILKMLALFLSKNVRFCHYRKLDQRVFKALLCMAINHSVTGPSLFRNLPGFALLALLQLSAPFLFFDISQFLRPRPLYKYTSPG